MSKLSRKDLFLHLLSRVQIFTKTKPDPMELLSIQKDLAKAIIFHEKRIKLSRRNKLVYKNQIRANLHDKGQVKKLQKKIKAQEGRIAHETFCLNAFRLIGDTIAWIFYDAHTLRQSSKIPTHAGFLS